MLQLRKYLIYAFLFFLPSQLGKHFILTQSFLHGVKSDYLIPTLYFTDLLVIILTAFYFEKLKTLLRKIPSKYVVVLFLVAIVNISFSFDPLISIYRWVKMFEIVLIFGIFYKEKLKQKYIVFALGLGALLQLILALYQISTGQSLQSAAYWLGERAFTVATPGIAVISTYGKQILRGYGTFSHPNSLAGFYLLLYGFFQTQTLRPSWLKHLSLMIFTLLIFISFSKIAITCWIGINLFLLLKNGKKLAACSLCLVSKLTIYILLPLMFLSASGDLFSLEKRAFLNMSAISIIIEHLFYGVGLGNYVRAQATIPNPYPFFFAQPVHNVFLLVFAELGLLLAPIVWIKKSLLRKINFSLPLMLCITIVVFTSMFDHYWLTLQQNFLLLPVVFALLLSDKRVLQL